MKKYLAILAMVCGFSSVAHAGLYLEPYVAYGTGKFKSTITITAPIADAGTYPGDETTKGPLYGGKVGFSFLNVALGADYMAAKLKTGDADHDTSNVGAFAQFSIPLVAKFSATYFPSSSIKSDSSSIKGKGFKAGVGFTFLPVVSLNVDYVSMKYDDVTLDGYTLSAGEASTNFVMVGVSIPLDL